MSWRPGLHGLLRNLRYGTESSGMSVATQLIPTCLYIGIIYLIVFFYSTLYLPFRKFADVTIVDFVVRAPVKSVN